MVAIEREPRVGPVALAPTGMTVAGLFAGIGGIELGLHDAGHRTTLLCEIDPHASKVLATRLPGIDLVADVKDIERLPAVDIVTAGFPCTDLSQAGRTAGIGGRNSGLVAQVFRLLEPRPGPRWLLLENVPFLLHLDRGKGMSFLVDPARGTRFRLGVTDRGHAGVRVAAAPPPRAVPRIAHGGPTPRAVRTGRRTARVG